MFLCWFYLLQSNLDIPETYNSSDRIHVRPGLGPGLSIAGGMTDLLPYGIKFSLSLSQCLVPDEAIEKNSPLPSRPPWKSALSPSRLKATLVSLCRSWVTSVRGLRSGESLLHAASV